MTQPISLDAFPQRAWIPPDAATQQQNQPGATPVQTILPYLTVREDHTDELVITEHPIEQGAAISDHAYKAPSQVIARYGWTNASEAAAGDPNYVNDFYALLLAFQTSRQPFRLITGKRPYDNMLVASIRTHTDDETATTLLVEVRFQQLIIVQTQTVTVAPANMAAPQINAPTVTNGTPYLLSAPSFNAPAAQAAAPNFESDFVSQMMAP